ncbi:MAG: bifunctional (p)ppGpp synthetase/guanosine-3',5'-bis(diphosphate) 3'-pyrophosphohydrolase [Candidatus Enterosoma sp.]|nr:bifunctional (p)ppGpp synthetase/guanosine-3',5'-bis(diphosphate) 3'-pyrophosphohydrolase [bacterium]MDY3210975.1 bifunctional (p)ppGpp synthetase/guanosine-3',5'-bis(diphosphate) 3'-pyrophosphohydrolase [Candidatus Enterosoma sp.]MDD7213539.1 bifunctional (p)ppGpp synthetase/guanosine-3',5'-bis(diphosphate) 3'-pyrophosphohydrolase [bacterium]MDD7571824.1 bifunctional (p)ppGpp synthetase/guanosine-3',5'-bis(diphosphate) 3'-pyrophosphohydrolase [bacterium]MDD7707687.1 bifunctional (p)ppGpp sy
MEIRNELVTFEDVKNVFSKYITSPQDQALIEKAYLFADKKHEGQVRKSGDPYICHCLGVAKILAELQAGPQTICVGLLHDTIEDTETTKEEIEKNFGKEVADLVEALTKVTRLSDYKNVEFTAENHRKIFVAMAKDVRAIIVKLADRLHNMRTLQFQPKEKQVRISKETLEVYAPIAHRLGLYRLQTEMEDLSLWYLDNEKYREIEDKMNSLTVNAHQALEELKKELSDILKGSKIPFVILDRVKSVYSIYKKMYNKNYSFEEIYDIMALRIITETEQNCYEILGYVHANFKPMPGRFKDYIAMPKPNMYQSLHTTILTNTGHFFEIQIRTKQMDETAEGGVAAHWRYKEGSHYDAKTEQQEIENQLHWFKDFVSMTEGQAGESAKEYVDTLSHDIFDANVYVFTPKGNVLCLPNGSTPIDFAYRIHSDLGEHLQGARVNGTLVPLSTALKTGDVVEAIINKNASPNSEWLNIAKTNFAKNRIRKYLVKQNADYVKEDAIKRGRQTLLDSLRERKLYIDITKLVTKKVLDQFKCETLDDLLLMVSYKTIQPYQIIDCSEAVDYDGKISAEEITKKINQRQIKKNSNDVVLLANGDTVMISLASCCTPIPGDDIIGFVSTGQGVKVHRKDCPNVNRPDSKPRLIDVIWNPNVKNSNGYPVDLAIECHDRNNLLIDILNAMTSCDAKVMKINAKYHPNSNTTTIALTLLVRDLEQLGHFIHTLMTIKSVFQVKRVSH